MNYNQENEEIKREELIIDNLLPLFEKHKTKSWVLDEDGILKQFTNRWFPNGKWELVKQISPNYYSGLLWGLKSGVYVEEKEGVLWDDVNDTWAMEKYIIFLIDKKNHLRFEIPNTIKKLKKSIIIKNSETITICDNPSIAVGSWDYKYHNYDMKLSNPEVEFFREWFEKFESDLDKEFKNKIEHLKKEKLNEIQRLQDLKVSQTNILSELDKDGNGEVDVVEGNDFNTLLKKHQKSIVEVDRNYVQQFVKVSSYLKTKKGNIQSIFNSIKDTPNQEVLNEYVEILKDEIHTYNLVLFNSLNMIVSLVEDDMITFYEIHEMFDSLNIFESKHEKDVSQKLTNIGDGLKDLMYEVRRMGNKISNSIQELSYVTEESNRLLENQLSEIDSTLKVGNLISVINTYQNYKTNRRLNL